MKWLHLTALTLFQPHKRLQLFLVFLITSDPLRLGPSWPLGASAHGRLPQHKRGDTLEESPICPSRSLKIGVAQLQWIYHICSGLCNSSTKLVQRLLSSALCTLHILVAFSLPKSFAQLFLVAHDEEDAFLGLSG